MRAKTRKVDVRIPKEDYEELEKLVEGGEYENISEAVRDAVRKLLKNYK